MTVPAGVLAEADADGWLKEALALALEANERWEPIAAELRAENAQLREENVLLRQELARRDAELEQVNAELAVLQRLVFGRSSERARPDAAGQDGNGAGERGGSPAGRRRGRAGNRRRDYSHLPRVEVVWDFPGSGYCCPECGMPFELPGDHVIEQVDWQMVVRVVATAAAGTGAAAGARCRRR